MSSELKIGSRYSHVAWHCDMKKRDFRNKVPRLNQLYTVHPLLAFTHSSVSPSLIAKTFTQPSLGFFKEIVKVKFRTQKYIAFKNNAMSKFQARWQLYLSYYNG